MAATIGQKHKNGFKIVEIWDNHSESLKNNLYNDFKGPEHLLGGMKLENEIDTCQTTVHNNFKLIQKTLKSSSLNRSGDENLPPAISANMETNTRRVFKVSAVH